MELSIKTLGCVYPARMLNMHGADMVLTQGVSKDLEIGCPKMLEMSKQGV